MYVCMYWAQYVCMYGIQLHANEDHDVWMKRVEYNCIGGGGSYKGGAVPPTDLRGIAQKMQGPENVYMVGPFQRYLASCMCNTSLYIC